MVKRIDILDSRPGDVIIWKRQGIVAGALSWLIKTLKCPAWDRWGWHLTVIVGMDVQVDACWPKVKRTTISQYLREGRECRVYRIFDTQPSQSEINAWTNRICGTRYDWRVYIWTAISRLIGRNVFPRFINNSYTCWETGWDFAEDMGKQLTDQLDYPFIIDFLKLSGEC